MSYHKYLSVISLFLLVSSLLSQPGFKTSLALDPGEPNYADVVAEYKDKFYVSGIYFDKVVGYWVASLSIYSNEGSFIKRYGITNDTTIQVKTSDAILDNDSYVVLGNKRITFLLEYNFDQDSFYISRRIKHFEYNLGPSSFLMTADKEKLFLAGLDLNEYRGVSVMRIAEKDTSFYKYAVPGKSQYADNMRFNSEGNIVTVVESDDSWNDTTYVVILDQDLNLIKNTHGTPDATNFSFHSGMTIDHEDNIICTGSRVTKPDGQFVVEMGAIKFDKEGKEIWKVGIADHRHVVDNWGSWSAITSSIAQDGYVLAGYKSYQTPEKDTSMRIPAIAKLDTNGDSLWYYTYSFRSDPEIQEVFNDVVATSDGGYLAVGRSVMDTRDSLYLPWTQSIILKVDANGLLDTAGVSTIELDTELDVLIYPNPTFGQLYLKQQKSEFLDIEIFNDSGQLVEKHFSDSSHHTAVVDLHGYPAGLYTIRARNRTGQSYTHRIVLAGN